MENRIACAQPDVPRPVPIAIHGAGGSWGKPPPRRWLATTAHRPEQSAEASKGVLWGPMPAFETSHRPNEPHRRAHVPSAWGSGGTQPRRKTFANTLPRPFRAVRDAEPRAERSDPPDTHHQARRDGRRGGGGVLCGVRRGSSGPGGVRLIQGMARRRWGRGGGGAAGPRLSQHRHGRVAPCRSPAAIRRAGLCGPRPVGQAALWTAKATEDPIAAVPIQTLTAIPIPPRRAEPPSACTFYCGLPSLRTAGIDRVVPAPRPARTTTLG